MNGWKKIILAISVAAMPFVAVAKENNVRGMDNPNRIENSYIVVFKSSVRSIDNIANAMSNNHGAQIKHKYSSTLKGLSIKLPDNAVKGLLKNPNVDYIEADTYVRAHSTPSWGLDRIDQRDLPLDGNFVANFTGLGTHAYILDSGIYASHSQFSGRLGNGVNYSGDATACDDHGTHVAGIVGGASYGVAPEVILHDIQVLGCDGGSTSDVIAGLDWVKANHMKPAVVNMSIGGSFSSAQNSAVQDLIDTGVTVVVSAGNDNSDACSQSPASAEDALTVGATERDDDRASYSNYGTCLDLFAPGHRILSATNSSDTASVKKNGTSMSAPHVAGAVANYLEKNPTALPAEVRNGIVGNASLNKVNGAGSGSPNLLLYSKVHNANAPSVPQDFHLQDTYCYGKKNASWSASYGNVSHYEIWTSSDNDWSNALKRYETTATSSYVNFHQDTYAKVRACNADECSAFSLAEYSKYHPTCY